jgi:hypothetical protein
LRQMIFFVKKTKDMNNFTFKMLPLPSNFCSA